MNTYFNIHIFSIKSMTSMIPKQNNFCNLNLNSVGGK